MRELARRSRYGRGIERTEARQIDDGRSRPVLTGQRYEERRHQIRCRSLSQRSDQTMIGVVPIRRDEDNP
jgi:hypothetical protein